MIKKLYSGLEVSLRPLAIDRRVNPTSCRDGVYLRLMAIPGVGPIAVLAFRAAVDDPARFARSRTVAPSFGLTPPRYQSGEADSPYHISKTGDADVRAALYTAANAMLMRSTGSSEIKRWGLRRMRRKGRRRAVGLRHARSPR